MAHHSDEPRLDVYLMAAAILMLVAIVLGKIYELFSAWLAS